MSDIGRMIAVSSQPDGLVQAPAPSSGAVSSSPHTHACNPGGDPHGATDTQVAESPKCREAANGRSHPLVPVQKTDRRGSDPGRNSWLGRSAVEDRVEGERQGNETEQRIGVRARAPGNRR